MWLLRGVLVAMIVYLPNQLRFPSIVDLKGLNSLNLMFLAAWILMWVHGIRAPQSAPLKKPMYFLFFMLTWAVFIGIVLDADQWAADLTLWKNSIFYLLLYFVFYHAANDRKAFWFYFNVVMFVAFVACLQGMRQGFDYGIGNYNETHRASGPFGPDYHDANRAAAFYVIFVPMFAALAMFNGKRRKLATLICLGLFAVGTLATLFTYSRQAFFILALSITLLALRRSILLVVLVGVALVNYQAWVPEGVVDRIAMTETANDDGDTTLDESTESRFLLWEGAGKLQDEYPFGIGLNHFKRSIGRYVPGLAGYDAHNNYVLLATEGSVVAAAALVIMILAMLRIGWRMQRSKDPDTAMLGVAYCVAVIGVMMSNFYGSRFFDGDVMGNFWVLTGLIARYQTFAAVESEEVVAAVEPVPNATQP